MLRCGLEAFRAFAQSVFGSVSFGRYRRAGNPHKLPIEYANADRNHVQTHKAELRSPQTTPTDIQHPRTANPEADKPTSTNGQPRSRVLLVVPGETAILPKSFWNPLNQSARCDFGAQRLRSPAAFKVGLSWTRRECAGRAGARWGAGRAPRLCACVVCAGARGAVAGVTRASIARRG